MYERVLVATDGSPRAEAAVHRATELARAAGLDEVHVVSACHPYTPGELDRIRHDLPDEFRDLVDADLEAENHVARARSIVNALGLTAVEHPMTGDAADVIVRTARDIDADLIIVGARGLGALGRVVHGSVSTSVAHHSPCDVLVVEHDD